MMSEQSYSLSRHDLEERYRRLSSNAWEQEIRTGFPVLQHVRSMNAQDTVEVLSRLPEADRIRFGLAMRNRREMSSSQENRERYKAELAFLDDLRRGLPFRMMRHPDWIEALGARRDKTLTAALRESLFAEATSRLGKRVRLSASEYAFWTPVGSGWILQTSFDFGGSARQVEYEHTLGLESEYVSSGNIAVSRTHNLHWFAMGENHWNSIVRGEEQKAAAVIGRCIDGFLQILPSIIEMPAKDS